MSHKRESQAHVTWSMYILMHFYCLAVEAGFNSEMVMHEFDCNPQIIFPLCSQSLLSKFLAQHV